MLTDLVTNSPHAVAQRAMRDSIHHSPQMVAQRALAARIGGGSLQAPNATLSAQRVENTSSASNRTGLPDQLKSGVESLSGMSMDHVKVHYNSSQPAQLNALAYAQGSDIHVAPGQEKHLPHEAWHVVQQAQGRVAPTMQMKGGVAINDDQGLEHEADVMGQKAMQLRTNAESVCDSPTSELAAAATGKTVSGSFSSIVQRVAQLAALVNDKLNVAGEHHPESDARRVHEKEVAAAKTGSTAYWTESQFKETSVSDKPADPYSLRYEHLLKLGKAAVDPVATLGKAEFLAEFNFGEFGNIALVEAAMKEFYADDLEEYGQRIEMYGDRTIRAIWVAGLRRIVLLHCGKVKTLVGQFAAACSTNVSGMVAIDYTNLEAMVDASNPLQKSLSEILEGLDEMKKALAQADTDFHLSTRNISAERSAAMHASAQTRAAEKGLWKVGNQHAADMAGMGSRNYNLLTRDEFNAEL